TGSFNTFLGASAGRFNTTGNNNTFVGREAGESNTGNNNAFVGIMAGPNTTGSFNAFFGSSAGLFNTTGELNVFVGADAGLGNTTGSLNTFVGRQAGRTITSGGNNVFIGNDTSLGVAVSDNNTVIGSGAGVFFNNLSFATAIGAGAIVTSSNTIVLGRNNGSDRVRIPGLGVAGSQQLCRNASNEIAACSSSLRYKTNIAPYRHGLDFIARLQPISFTWKDGGMLDLGFGAEDVAKVDPLLVIYNKDGRVEGVKYDRISAVLVNAVKEQQTQITTLRDENQRLTQQSDDFKSQMVKQAEEFKAQMTAIQSRLAQLETTRPKPRQKTRRRR
ncbi:MAG: tail fiber domain-containing protein, partial [Blastocatellia bacterium]